MSDQERQSIALLVGKLDGKLDGVIGKVDGIEKKMDSIDQRQFRIDSKLNEGYERYSERLDKEKDAREAIERDIKDAKRDFAAALNAHAESDRNLSEKLDTLINVRAEERKTWLGRAWSVAKYVLLLAGAWLSAKLGVTPPSL